jgi:hypothetical protein
MKDTPPKRRPGRPATVGTTPITTMRLGEDTLANLDYLTTRLGLTNRTDVVRFMAQRMASEERRKEAAERG